MPRFGPTIWDELIAAGLGGEPILIEGDDLVVGGKFPAEKGPALAEVLRNHDPNKQKEPIQGPLELFIRALLDEGIISPVKASNLLKRLAGR